MTDPPTGLEDVVGGDLPADEHARLQRAHEMLIQAGPAPELPPSLAQPPAEPSTPGLRFPRRRRWTAISAVAAAAVVVLAIGYGIGNRSDVRPPTQAIPLSGEGDATGSIEVFAADDAGNWPLRLIVAGLPQAEDGRFELWLTRDGALADLCGSFAATDGAANVRLNAPYRLRTYDDWVVVAAGSSLPLLGTTGSAPSYREPPA